jgi:hypothetical protein
MRTREVHTPPLHSSKLVDHWLLNRFTNTIVNPREARQPAVAAFAARPKGRLPAGAAGLEPSMPGVLMTAFGANPHGSGTLLRLWEQAGGGGEPVRVNHGEFTVAVEPFAPVSLLARLE